MVDATATSHDKPILLLGIGRGGIQIATLTRATCNFPGLITVAADTDADTLSQAHTDRTLLLGEAWTRGEGCGGDADLAERAAGASSDDLRALLSGARLVFVTAGLGGGIGNVVPRLVAKLAHEGAVPAVFLVTLPFSFEGATRAKLAEQAVELLRQESETVIAVPNSLLFAHLPPDTASARAFEVGSQHLARALAGLVRIWCAKGLLTVDLAGVRRLVRKPGCVCTLALGQGQGATAAATAVSDFLASPFIGDPARLQHVSAALLSVLGGDDLSIGTVQECLEKIQHHVPRNAQILIGAYTDPRLQGEVQLTGLLVRDERPAGKGRRPVPVAPGEEPPKQGTLTFPEQQLGLFAGSSQHTFHNGENLDIPTFQRRNIPVDAGEDL